MPYDPLNHIWDSGKAVILLRNARRVEAGEKHVEVETHVFAKRQQYQPIRIRQSSYRWQTVGDLRIGRWKDGIISAYERSQRLKRQQPGALTKQLTESSSHTSHPMNPEIDPTDGMISRSALASHLLVNRMIELSRNFYSAEWISGLEFDVWDMAFENKKLFGSIEVTDRMAKLFRDLATLSDGWWVFEDKDQPEEDGPVFIPMHRWKQILSEHNSR